MTAELWIAAAVAIFGGGGLVALLRLRGETAKIVVDAAQGAVIVQSSVIKDLQAQVATMQERMSAVEKRASAAEERAAAAEERAVSLGQERDALLRANQDLLERVAHLEQEVQQLRGRRR